MNKTKAIEILRNAIECAKTPESKCDHICSECRIDVGIAEGCEALEMAVKALEQVPGWIPCSERLPEDNRQVLVYAQSTHFVLAKYDEMREADGSYKMMWVTYDAYSPLATIRNVIAWMPLPEPWKGWAGR